MPELLQPHSGIAFEVDEKHADYWRSLGYTDAKPVAAAKPKKAAAKKSTSKSGKK